MQRAFIFTISLICSLTGISQSLQRNIQTQSVEQAMLKLNSVRQQKNAIEGYLSQHKIHRIEEDKIIPLLFHIFYTNAEEEISFEQIQSQIDALNQHFRGEHTADQNTLNMANLEAFDKVQAKDLRIQFCLAAFAEDGLSNVNYIAQQQNNWTTDDAIKTLPLGQPPIQPDKYLNIWVAHLDEAVSGYATMPWAPTELDGIVIDYRYFGTMGTAQAPFHQGNTLTHLIGNYLGLYDLWNNHCEDDGVSDTPIHNAPNIGCPDYKHVTTCYEHQVEMTMNFMDNTDDSCMYMFTEGQFLRMHQILSGPRSQLLGTPGQTICSDPIPTLVEQPFNYSEEGRPLLSQPADFSIQPNPAHDKVELVLHHVQAIPEDKIHLTVFSVNGKAIFEQSIAPEPRIEIPTSSWLPGLYYLQIDIGLRTETLPIVVAR